VSAWALVPLKARAAGKQRLAPELSAAERSQLIESMFARVLSALGGSHLVAGIAVVTPDPQALPKNVLALPDAGPDMNGALAGALTRLTAQGVRRCAVVSADLPLLRSAEVDELLTAGGGHDLVLAPDRHERGTNALVLDLPARLPLRFGADSLLRHVQEARAQALTATLVRLPGLQLDVDLPADLLELRARTVEA
jgi:2-phospho-L-lactate/phosphoenolpyruvate guanylyltransferase